MRWDVREVSALYVPGTGKGTWDIRFVGVAQLGDLDLCVPKASVDGESTH